MRRAILLLAAGAALAAAGPASAALGPHGGDRRGPGGLLYHADPNVPGSARRALAADPGPAWAGGLPTRWCGREETDDRPAPPVQDGQLTVKVVYVATSDLPGRLPYFASALQANASQIDRLVAWTSGGRKTVRFDLGSSCGPQYLDILTVRLPGTRDSYLYDDPRYPGVRYPYVGKPELWAALQKALAGSYQDRRVFFLFMDGFNVQLNQQPGGAWTRRTYTWDWGAAGVWPDDRADPAVQENLKGVQYAQMYGTDPAAFPGAGVPPLGPEGERTPSMMAHEIFHTLGAVMNSAPHSTGYLHCRDGEDIMCYRDSDQPQSDQIDACPSISFLGFSQSLDCGADDYFSAAPAPGSWLAGHWNTFNSPYLASCSEEPQACGHDASLPAPPPSQVHLRVPTQRALKARRLRLLASCAPAPCRIAVVAQVRSGRVRRTVRASAASIIAGAWRPVTVRLPAAVKAPARAQLQAASGAAIVRRAVALR